MGSFGDSIADSVSKTLCGVVDVFEGSTELFSKLPINTVPRSAIDFWKRINRNLCDKQQPGGSPPFEGGQCECVKYIFRVYGEKYSTAVNATCEAIPIGTGAQTDPYLQTVVWGPIESYELVKTTNNQTTNSYGVKIKCRGAGSSACQTSAVTITPITFASRTESIAGTCPEPKITSIDVIREDGLSDDCPGEILPPPPPPGWNVVNNYNYTWIDNSNNVINDFGDFTFGFAYLDADFDIKIPVKIKTGDLNFTGNFNVDKGAFEFDFGDDITNVNNPNRPVVRRPRSDDRQLPEPDPDAPDDPNDIDDDPDVIEDDNPPDEQPVENNPIVAVRVVVTQVNNKSIGTLVQTRNPDIAIPNYGYIQFFIQTGEAEGGWSRDIAVKNRNHFIECPWPDGALLVRGTPRTGVSWNIQALRKRDARRIAYPVES